MQKSKKALMILIVAMIIVYMFSACNRDNVSTIMQEINETTKVTTAKPIETTKLKETTKAKETTKPKTTTAIAQGDSREDHFDTDLELDQLSTKMEYCSFKRNSEHEPVLSYIKADLGQFGAYQMVNTDEKVVYLTFDEGYENGYTEQILDTLLENDVKATFFVTASYVKNNVVLTKRMKDEGHLVGNHSVHHYNMTELTDEEVRSEILDAESIFNELTGYEMDYFFRPPEGAFSERSLYLTREVGYRTILWSMAYADWNVNEQKGKDYAYNHVMDNYHNGAIILLHAVSQSNTEALDDILKSLKDEGYRFGSLYEVE